MAKIELNDATITIGRPIGNTEIYILGRHLNPVPVGVPGEMYIGGAGVARGYHNRPELTEERFIAHPFDHRRSKVYRTGDLARYMPDGRIEHLGRLDHQVKIRGFRIELGEVEAGLQAHPEIGQAVVTAGHGHGADGLVAYVLPRNGVVAAPEELRSFLRNTLPDFMVPNAFVSLNEFPLTPNGKIDVAALPRWTDGSRSKQKARIGPRTTLEAQLVALFEQVLGVYDIGIRDSFFDLGGHSLTAVQLFARLDQIYGWQLPLATLFQAPTVEELAQLFTQSGWTAPWRSLVAINPQGSLPPIFAIPGVEGYVLGFGRLATLLGNDQPFYALQPRGLSKHEQPFTNVERMAEHYIDEIRSVQPKGPYLMCGACTGGVLAYEVAQQLSASGENVGLAMLESWHPSSYRAYRLRPAMFWWSGLFLFAKAMRRIRESARLPLKEWPAFYREKLKAVRQSMFEAPEKAGFDPQRVTAATYLAVSRYRPKPFPGSLLNVISSERPTSAGTQDTRRLWEKLALKGCHTVQVPATDSGRLLVSPYVELVTRELHEYATQELSLGELPREQHQST
jgi:thioesterase domain-containing protein/acyl carrier protein